MALSFYAQQRLCIAIGTGISHYQMLGSWKRCLKRTNVPFARLLQLKLSGQEASILFNRSDHSSYFHARDAVQSRLELRQEAIDLEHKWNNRNQKKK